MLRSLLAATVLASTAFAVAATVGTEFLGSGNRVSAPSPIDDAPQCEQVMQHEPLVAFDVSGSTLLGGVQMHLAVYDDGEVSLSEMVEYTGTARVEHTNIGSGAAHALLSSLRDANAFELCDQAQQVLDVPLSTLTVFRGGSAHTFSYWLGNGDHAAVQSILLGFLENTFPN